MLVHSLLRLPFANLSSLVSVVDMNFLCVVMVFPAAERTRDEILAWQHHCLREKGVSECRCPYLLFSSKLYVHCYFCCRYFSV